MPNPNLHPEYPTLPIRNWRFHTTNVVENSIESDLKLVDGAVGEYVGFGDCHVPPVIVDILVTGEGILFGKSRSAAGYVLKLPDRS